MAIHFAYSGFTNLGGALLLTYFDAYRFKDYLRGNRNFVNTLYLLGTGPFAIALYLYSLPEFFPQLGQTFATNIAIVATTITLLGLGNFVRIILRSFFPSGLYAVFSHMMSLYILVAIAAMIVQPPLPVLGGGEVMEWHFTPLESVLILTLNASAFGLNAWFAYRAMRTAQRHWIPKLIFLIATFAFSTLGCGYIYFGNDDRLLYAAYTALFIAQLLLVTSSLLTPSSKSGKELQAAA